MSVAWWRPMCDCIDRMNEGLAEHNACLDIPLMMNFKTGETYPSDRVMICCYKIDTKKRGRIPHLFANYCPFCGQAYAVEDQGAAP